MFRPKIEPLQHYTIHCCLIKNCERETKRKYRKFEHFLFHTAILRHSQCQLRNASVHSRLQIHFILIPHGFVLRETHFYLQNNRDDNEEEDNEISDHLGSELGWGKKMKTIEKVEMILEAAFWGYFVSWVTLLFIFFWPQV